MEFPAYSNEERSIHSPLETYMSNLADYTYDQDLLKAAQHHATGDRHLDRAWQASAYMGRACIDLLYKEEHHDNRADRLLGEVIREGHYLSDSPVEAVRRQVEFMMSTAAIIRGRQQPRLVEYLRQSLHLRIANQLNTAYQAMTDDTYNHRTDPLATRYHGVVSELTATGLLTRLAHPRLLALPSMPHQDYVIGGKSQALGNDIVLVEADEQGKTTAHYVQVKSACLEFCKAKLSLDANDFRATASRRTNHVLSRYSHNTALVSACCDLDEHFTIDTTQSARITRFSSPLTELLVREAHGKATDDEVRQLDMHSGQLLLAITGDERRRGSFKAPTEHYASFGAAVSDNTA